MAIQYIRELEEGASNESMVDDKIVSKILRKEIVLMNISALKQQILKSQILLNAERMQKKLYLGVKLGIVNKDSKKAQEYLISKYIKVEEKVLKFEGLKLDLQTFKSYIDGEEIELTLKEFNILKLMISSYPTVVSREKLIEKIWGYDYFGDTRVIDAHMKNIRKKIKKDYKKIQARIRN